MVAQEHDEVRQSTSLVDEPSPKRRRPPLVTREQVVEVAYGLVVEDGPDGLSMRKLAGALHVSLPTVYTAINSREFLVRQLQNRLLEDIAARLATVDAELSPSDPGDDDRLGLLIRTFLDWAGANPQLADFLLSEEFSAEVARRVSQPDQNSAESVAYVVGLCRELAGKGQLPVVDPVVGVAFTVAQLRAVLSLIREPALGSVAAARWQELARTTVLGGLECLSSA